MRKRLAKQERIHEAKRRGGKTRAAQESMQDARSKAFWTHDGDHIHSFAMALPSPQDQGPGSQSNDSQISFATSRTAAATTSKATTTLAINEIGAAR